MGRRAQYGKDLIGVEACLAEQRRGIYTGKVELLIARAEPSFPYKTAFDRSDSSIELENPRVYNMGLPVRPASISN